MRKFLINSDPWVSFDKAYKTYFLGLSYGIRTILDSKNKNLLMLPCAGWKVTIDPDLRCVILIACQDMANEHYAFIAKEHKEKFMSGDGAFR